MGQRTRILTESYDDLDDSLDAPHTRTFSVGTTQWVIDLCDENVARFDAEMKFWTDAARRVTGRGKRKPAAKQPTQSAPAPAPEPEPQPEEAAARTEVAEETLPIPVKDEEWWRHPGLRGARQRIRHWGRTHGWPHLGDRGSVPNEVYDAWYDRVWAKLPDPSWEALDRATASAGHRNGKVVATARRTARR